MQEGEHGVVLAAPLHAEGLHLLLGWLLDLVQAAVRPLPLVQQHDLVHALQPLAPRIQGLGDKETRSWSGEGTRGGPRRQGAG